MHLASGAPKAHANNYHNEPLTRSSLVANTQILRHEQDFNRLQIYEAFYIQQFQPALNNQSTGSTRILKLHSTQQAPPSSVAPAQAYR